MGVLTRAVFRTVLSEVGNGVFQICDAVLEQPHSTVAMVAKKSPNLTCLMAVIYIQVIVYFLRTTMFIFLPANGTHMPLSFAHFPVLLFGNAVSAS